jgi:hypothetical protein
VRLDAAKGTVHDCEETLEKLQAEIELTDPQLERIEQSMGNLKLAMVQAHRHRRSVSTFSNCEFAGSVASGSLPQGSTEHDYETRLALSHLVATKH